jgi:hypothetical protein
MAKLNQGLRRQAELDRVPGDRGGLLGILHGVAGVLDAITDLLAESHTRRPFLPVYSSQPLLCRFSGRIWVIKHSNCRDRVEVEATGLDFEVNRVLTTMADDPAFDG